MKAYFNNKQQYLNVSKCTGKMEGILSLSTLKTLNPNCMALSKCNNTICSHCYVDRGLKLFKDLKPALKHNTEILTTYTLTKSDIQEAFNFLKNTLYFRFESHGDLINLVQLNNYVNIAKMYPNCNFALWSKQFKLVLDYFKQGNKMPSNLRLVLSSPVLNSSLSTLVLDTFKKYHKQVISFNVTSNKNDNGINCGKKQCLNCLNCYKKGKASNVLELLK